jgi:hypothetical protein
MAAFGLAVDRIEALFGYDDQVVADIDVEVAIAHGFPISSPDFPRRSSDSVDQDFFLPPLGSSILSRLPFETLINYFLDHVAQRNLDVGDVVGKLDVDDDVVSFDIGHE